MSNKSVILSAGDSFATFDTHDCDNPEIIYRDCHAVQIIAEKYNVDAYNGGLPGGGTQDGVVQTLYNIHNIPNIKLIFFHITQKSRIPTDDIPNLETKLEHMNDYYSLTHIDPVKNINNVMDPNKDYTKFISTLPLFKIDLDDIAYLTMLVQVCKQHNIGIIFVSEFISFCNSWKDMSLFTSEPHVRVCDSVMSKSSGLDESKHNYLDLLGNHLCQHYQSFIANEYLERYSEFISDSLL